MKILGVSDIKDLKFEDEQFNRHLWQIVWSLLLGNYGNQKTKILSFLIYILSILENIYDESIKEKTQNFGNHGNQY